MNNHAEELDYWNEDTGISILKLEVLPLQAQKAPEPGQAMIGRLFTAVAGLTSSNGEDIKAVITGYLRKQTPYQEAYQWVVEDCYAPRSHNNGIPPIRLLAYPQELTTDTGGRIPPLDLSRLIAGQLDKDVDWRAQVVERLDDVTPEDMHIALRIPYEPEEASDAEESLDRADAEDIDLDLDAPEPETHDASEVGQPASEDLDDIDLDSEIPDTEEAGGADDQPEQNQVPEAAEDESADEDDEDFASLIDEWDDEDEADDLAGLANESEATTAIDELVDLDGDEDIQAHEAPSESYNRKDTVATSFEWAKPADEDQPEAQSEPAPEVEPDDLEIPHAEQEMKIEEEAPAAASVLAEPVRPTLSAVPSQPRKPEAPETEDQKVAKECVLHNDGGYDIGFFGFEHGSMSLVDGNGEAGTLYTTKGGTTVVHIDGCRVEEISQENKDELFNMMGYSREAKKLYKKANLNCVRWLD